MTTREVRWARLTSPQIAAAAASDAVVVVPVGSIEQHGPHLPTMTDSACIEHLVQDAVDRLDGSPLTLIAPTVPFGFSADHLGFAGTLSVPAELLADLLVEIGRSILLSGFRRLVYLNGHGSNASLLYYVVRRIRDLAPEPVTVTAATYWSLAREELAAARRSEKGGMGHACELETSLMLHYEPETVDMALAVREIPKAYSPYRAADLLSTGPAVAPDRFRDRTHSGVQGDPTVADAEHGAHMASLTAAALARFLRDFASWNVAIPDASASGHP